MDAATAIVRRLAQAPGIPLRTTLTRCVALDPLLGQKPVNFLFTSGKPNRYNPAGVQCVYFAEDEQTAQCEYQRQWEGIRVGAKQPFVTFYAEVELHHVLDLTARDTCKILRLTGRDLHAPWRLARRPTKTQVLGLALSRQTTFTAIRYPSDAARHAGIAGNNLVIFKAALRSPDRARILGPRKNPLQQWP